MKIKWNERCSWGTCSVWLKGICTCMSAVVWRLGSCVGSSRLGLVSCWWNNAGTVIDLTTSYVLYRTDPIEFHPPATYAKILHNSLSAMLSFELVQFPPP